MKNEFLLVDLETAVDLQAFLNRAKRLDPSGLVRLRAYGNLLAAYVAPIFAGGIMDAGPTVLGLRTCELAKDAEVEGLVTIQAILDRLARVIDVGIWNAKDSTISLPPNERAAWGGILPPRSGWAGPRCQRPCGRGQKSSGQCAALPRAATAPRQQRGLRGGRFRS
ncbi:MAG: hypothetical protein EBY26_05545 [Microbacteriaceae bacterium]|nr:hypothetical protein [Microbacteriaceae bacterium]